MASTIPGYTILPMVDTDLPALARLILASKLELPINRFLWSNWPNEAAQAENARLAGQTSFADPNSEQFKVVKDDTGEIVGHLVLTYKRPSQQTFAVVQKSPDTSEIMKKMNPEILEWVSKASASSQKLVEDREHLVITHFYVVPASRRQGLASSLIRLALLKGKDAGLPVFLAVEPQALPLVLAHGFKEINHSDVDLSKYAPKNSGWGNFRLSAAIFEN